MELIVATGNEGKRREFEVLLADLAEGLELFSLESWPEELPEVVEDRETFEGNAFKKALETSLATGVSALSDDSGLEVDALDGRPGVYSARYSDAGTDLANNAKLVRELRGVPLEDRTARYVAVVALALADDAVGEHFLQRRGLTFDEVPEADDYPATGELARVEGRVLIGFRGTCEGLIVDEPLGDGGFGYDPHFYVPDWDARMSEVSLARKNERSHRARAVRQLVAYFDAAM